MAFDSKPIRLDNDELYTPEVDDYLERQSLQRRDVPEVAPRPWFTRIFYSSYFYLSLASGLGAFVAWLILEPFYNDFNEGMPEGPGNLPNPLWVNILLFPIVTAFAALFLGAAEGVVSRNPLRSLLCGAVGLGVGVGLGLVLVIPTEILFYIMRRIASEAALAQLGGQPPAPGQGLPAIFLIILIMGRAAAWAIAAIPAGLGQGVALWQRKIALNGLVGSLLGGLLGGALFDPIGFLISGEDGTGDLSRAVGFTVIGLMVGLFVGVVEQWTKTAWLLMRQGPLAGKQFIVYRNPTVLGSSPKADVYLFKDEAIEPSHALLHNRGGRYELEDMNTPDGTYVNGIPIQRRILRQGDTIVLGKTVLEFSLREGEA